MTDRVELLLRCSMPERFIGRALREGICLHRIERTQRRELRLSATERDARRLMEIARQLGIELTIEGEAGRPAIRSRLRQRWTLAPGLLLMLMLIVSFTARIWRVEAVSLDGETDAAVLQAICESVRSLGIQPGTLRSGIDRDELAMQLHAMRPELTHVSVRAEGVFLKIEIATEQTAPEVYDISRVRDLVAARDAIVVYAEPLAGKACVKAGDAVRRGQTLILGEERVDTDVMRGVRALGTVIGRVWFTAECSEPTQGTVSRRTGRRRTGSGLRLGGWTWPIAEAASFSSQETETEALPVGGLYLPLRMERTILWETVEETVFKDMEALRTETGAQALAEARRLLPAEALETDCWIDWTEQDGILTARATVQAEMNIAAEREALID